MTRLQRWMEETMVIRRRRTCREGGQAILEFALVLPVLILIIMACIEYGWYFTSRYELGTYSREIGYNIKEPFNLYWKHETAPRDWVDSSKNRKPSWLTADEKRYNRAQLLYCGNGFKGFFHFTIEAYWNRSGRR